MYLRQVHWVKLKNLTRQNCTLSLLLWEKIYFNGTFNLLHVLYFSHRKCVYNKKITNPQGQVDQQSTELENYAPSLCRIWQCINWSPFTQCTYALILALLWVFWVYIPSLGKILFKGYRLVSKGRDFMKLSPQGHPVVLVGAFPCTWMLPQAIFRSGQGSTRKDLGTIWNHQ